MLLGQNPRLEWKSRGIWRDGQKIVVLRNHSNSGFGLLPRDVAKNAALFIDVILLRAFDFFSNVYGHNRQRDQLRMRVLQSSASGFPVVLEDQDVFEAAVLLQIENAVAEGPQYVFNLLRRKRGQ